jgi:pimeloyl-ACP methyl ester carboxylesterase
MLAGALLVLRPFASHSLLVWGIALGLIVGGLAELVQGSREAPARWLLGSTYLAGAALIAFWPEVPLVVVGLVVGLLLVATGALEVWSGLLTRTRLPALLVGAAAGGLSIALSSGVVTLAMGVVSALWADIVLLPMTITLGTRLLLVGAGLLVDIWYPPTGYGASTERYRLLWRLAGLGLAVTLFVVGLEVDHGRPRPSEFYYRDIPAETAAGKLLKADLYPNEAYPNSVGIRLLYVTQNQAGESVTASAVLYVPSSTSAAELPLVVWAHAETGITQGCAPSVLGESSGGLVAVPQLLAAGYAVLAPDYEGLGAPATPSYLIGVAEGRALLDAVRASAQVPGVRLGGAVLWGYSQGGHAALWAGQIAPDYAPEVKISGIAVDAPIADPAAVLASQVQRGEASQTAAYLLFSYAANYSEVAVPAYLNLVESGLAEETAARCGGVGWAARNWAAVSGATGAWSTDPNTGALGARMAQNAATGGISAPLLVLQGAADQVVPQSLTDTQVALRCQTGKSIDYRVYPGLSHVGPANAESPQFDALLSWTADRFAGRAEQNTCVQAHT